MGQTVFSETQQFTTTSAPDTTIPTLAITSPSSNGTTVSNVTLSISGTASDNVGVSTVYVSLNGGGYSVVSGTTSWSTSRTLSVGSNTISAYSQDAAGNQSAVATRTVTYSAPDTTNPSIVITNPSSNGTTVSSAALSISGTASDNVGVSTVYVSLNGGGYSVVSGTTTWSTSRTLSAGSNTISAYSQDAAGNQSTVATRTVTYSAPDTTSPSIVITNPSSNGTTVTSASLSISGTASDNVGVATVFVSLNGNAYVSATGTTSWSTSRTLSAGSNTISAYSQDAAGNQSAVATRTVTYSAPDTTSPSIVITNPSSNGTTVTSASLSISGTASDNVGVATVFVSLNGNAYVSATGTTTWSTSRTLSVGSNTITAYSQDAAGNQSAVATRTVTYTPTDTTIPTLAITSPSTNGTTVSNATLSISGTASDNVGVATVFVSLNGNAYVSATGTTTWSTSRTLSVGSNTITAYSQDAAGNQSTVATRTVTYTPTDTTIPTLVITSPSTNGTTVTSASLSISGTASDNVGVATVFVSLNGNAYVSATGTTTWSTSRTLSVGSNTITAYSQDAAGNQSTVATRTVTYTPTDDVYEDNDTLATASDISGNERDWFYGLIQRDYDWYKIDVTAGYTRIQVDCRFTHAAGDIDIRLVDSSGNTLTSSPGIVNNEFIDYDVAQNGINSGVIYIQVYGPDQGSNYDLWWDDLQPTDTTIPTLAITSPSTNGTTVSSASLSISGTASDNVGVATVFVSLNGNAYVSATGTTTWSTSRTLSVGSNTINAYSQDAAGNQSAVATRTVTYTPTDTTIPTLAITSPSTNGTTVSSASLSISGTASDNVGVATVFVSLNGNAYVSATGTTTWSTSRTLSVGSNTINAYSQDAAGNQSTVATRTVTYTPTDDIYEDNETLATASDFSANERNWFYGLIQRDYDWYKIQVSAGFTRIQVDCRFIHSTGDIDIRLLDSSGNTLTTSHGVVNNEFIDYDVAQNGINSGVLYIQVYGPDQGSSYDLWWDDLEPPVTPPSAPTAATATAITSASFTANWGTVSGATGYRLDVSSSSSFGSFVSGYNDLDVGNVTNSSVSGLISGSTYYYRVRAYNTGGPSGNSSVITVALAVPDDHGNSTGTATVVAVNTSVAGNIETIGDLDYFRINLASAGTLNIQSTGTFDVEGWLYNDLGAQLDTDDDDGVDNNFLMEVSGLAAGTYYVVVRHFADTATGNYGVQVNYTPTSNLGRVLVVAASDFKADVVNKLSATGLYTAVDLFDAAAGTPTLAQLQTYVSVLVFSDATFSNSMLLGDNLADYVDAGGGLVVATFTVGSVPIAGRILTGGYLPFNAGGQSEGSVLTLEADLPASPLLAGVTSFSGGSASFHGTITLASGATQVAHWSNNVPLVIYKSVSARPVVALNFFPPSSTIRADFWDAATNGVKLMTNALGFVTGTNSAPTDITLSSSSIAENNAASATVGNLSATDVDVGDTHTFTMVTGTGSTDNASFTILGNALKLTPVADFETQSTYAIRVRATDSGTGSLTFEKQFTIAVANVNEVPSFAKGVDQSLPADTNAAQSVAGWATGITDGDSTVVQALSFNVSNSNNGLFTVQPSIASNGTLSYTPNGTAGSATVNVSLTDDNTINGNAALTSAVQTFTITVAAGPEIAVSGNSSNIADGDTTPGMADHTDFGSVAAASGTVVRTFTITNSGPAALNLTGTPKVAVGGTHAADFAVSALPASPVAALTGTTTFQVTFNPIATGVRTATLSVDNNDSNEHPFNFSVQGTGTNSAPTDITLSSSSIAENNAVNATVGTLSAMDVDVSDTHSFTLVTGTGSTDNASFTIAGNALKLTPIADFETQSTYAIRVRATDSGTGSLTFEKQFTVAIINANEAPTDLALSVSSIAENNAANATVGTLSATDVDVGDTHSFTLVAGTGSTDNASFTLVGNSLRLTSSADFESKNSYSIRVRGTDSGTGSLTIEKAFTVTITNVNEVPTDLVLSPSSIAENNTANATVGALSAIDADVGDTHTFALVTGTGSTDNASFTIVGNALKLTPSANFETKNSYALRVRGTDSGTGNLTLEKAFTVTITNVNEVPTDLALSPSSIAENNAANATVGTLSATDVDVSDTHSFTLVTGTGSTDNASFTIVGNSLRLTPSANFETKNSYALRVRGTDSGTGNLTLEKAFTVTILDVNDLPSINDLPNLTIVEDAVGGTGALTLTMSDDETAPASLGVTVTSSDSTVVPNTPTNLVLSSPGANRTLTVLPAPNGYGSSIITVTVADANGGQNSDAFLLTVSAVNDAPTITSIGEQAILPNATTGALPFTILDAETSAASLILGKDSSNQTLVPLSNIVFGGSGNNRTVTVTPASGQTAQSIITVSVSDGVITTPTTFLLRVSNNNAHLASLTLSSGTLSPAFASGTIAYNGTVPNAGSSITVTPTLADANATVRVNGNLVTSGTPSGAITLSVGSNPAITVLVTAQDGTTKTYTITPTRNPRPIASTNGTTGIGTSSATLRGVVNPLGVSTAVTFNYGVTELYGSTVTVPASPLTGSVATHVSVVPNDLLPGTLYHFQVVAENSTERIAGADMTFTTISDNARLAGLTLSSGSITFQPDTLSYSITVPNSPANLTLTPTVQQANATLKINTVSAPSGTGTTVPLTVGDSAIPILVTAQDGTTTRTYTLNVRRRSTDATLASLSLSGITLSPAFAAGTTSYTASVPFTTASTTVTATKAHASADVTSGTGLRSLTVGSNALSMLVTAEDGNTQTYTVTVTRDPASTNASLAGLTLGAGTLTPAFASGTLSYSATVAANVGSVTVTPTVQQPNATLTIQGTSGTSGAGRVVSLVTGDNAVPIVVTAQDGTTTQTYSLTIRRRSAVADLASLSLSGVTLSPAFISGTTAYTATVPNATTSTTITAAATHASASIAGAGSRTLNVGSNPLTVAVTAEEGNTKDYTVTVLRNPLPVAVTGDATTITATSATLNGSINAGGVSTSTSFEYGTTTAYGQTVAGTPGSVSGTSAASTTAAITNLTPGTEYHFRAKGMNVTDSDEGDDMTFTTLRNNANLASLSVSAGSLSFNASTTTYNMTVANAVTSITVTPTAADSAATVKVNTETVASRGTSSAITLIEGINPAINVLVTAEDGTTKNYALIYNRALSPSVSGLVVSNITKSSAKLAALVNANGEATTVSVEYSPDGSFATFTSIAGTPSTVTGTSNTNVEIPLTGLSRSTPFYWRVRATSAGAERVITGSNFTTLDSDAYILSLVPNDYNILRIWYYTPTLTPSFSPNQTIYFSDVEEEVPEFSCVIKVPSLSAQVYDGDSLLGASGSYLTAYKRHLLTGANTLTITVKDVDLDISRSYTITINRAPGPPYFFYDLRPEPALTILGRPHFLDIPIAGQSPIAFQWKKDNVNVAGATAKRYDIPTITAAHAGRYKLVAQNTLGGATSQEFVLGVITSQPPPRVTLATNGTLSLSVSAVVPKGMKLFYYWLANDSELVNGGRFSGVNSSTLRITGMTLADEGTYKCQVQMRDGDYSNFDFQNTDGTEVLMAELPEISANPLPGGIVSALYSQPFPTNGAARKTPTSYAATGLPTGLKCDTKTGRISGRPTAAKKDKFGAVIPYDVTLTAKNPKGTATQKVTLRVEPLPWHAVGVFAAPLGRDAALSEGLGGRLEMTVLSTGILSGKAILGTASWPFTGVLDGGPEPTATVTIKRKTGQIPLTMTFGIGGATHYLLRDGSMTDGTATLSFTGWRQALAEHVLDFAGYHTFGILPPPLTAAPRATGYGSFTVSKTGTLTLAGKTADGETITGAALTGIGGDIVIYQTLYTTKLKGSLQGSMKIDHLGSTNAENTLNGTVSWSRPAGTALIYPAGFGPEDYTITGGGYATPDAKAGQIVMALPDTPDNAALRFDTNSAQVPAFMPDLSIRIRPGSLVERPVVNPAKTTLVITSTTGAFTGAFTLVDANPLPVPASPRTITRTVKYQGLIYRNSGWRGAGYFLMPELPSAQWPTATKTPVIPGGVFLGAP